MRTYSLLLLALGLGGLLSCDKGTDNGANCPATGIICSVSCPADGRMNGVPCVKGVYRAESCLCDTKTAPAPQNSCESTLGGTCVTRGAALVCPNGFEAAEQDKSCRADAGCCKPRPYASDCKYFGGVCVALTANGLSCPAGFGPDATAGYCAPGSGCCTGRVDDGRCAAAGGQCAPILDGVTCPKGYGPDGNAGSCGPNAACCAPLKPCEQAGGRCAALTPEGVPCPDGYVVPDFAIGTCDAGAVCCAPRDAQ